MMVKCMRVCRGRSSRNQQSMRKGRNEGLVALSTRLDSGGRCLGIGVAPSVKVRLRLSEEGSFRKITARDVYHLEF